MGILGMRGIGHFGADERPKNWRETILFLEPNGDSPLTAIMTKLKNKVTTDIEFNHFEKEIPVQRALVDGSHNSVVTSIAVATGTAAIFKAGHAVLVESTLEILWVSSDPTSPFSTLTVIRAKGSEVAATIPDGEGLLIIGSHYAENAGMPESVSYSPTTVTNYTQDIRTSFNITHRARNTKLRTGDSRRELQRETNVIHGIEMEKAFLFGSKQSSTSANMTDTTTGGLLEWCSTSVKNFAGAATIEDWENYLELLFRYGSEEKLALVGSTALLIINRIARLNGHILLDVGADAYGMAIMKWITPFGTLYLKRHPLLCENATFRSWGFVVDTKKLVYRYLTNSDTRFLKDVTKDGKHAERSEFASDCGLELQFEKVHGYFQNLSAIAA